MPLPKNIFIFLGFILTAGLLITVIQLKSAKPIDPNVYVASQNKVVYDEKFLENISKQGIHLKNSKWTFLYFGFTHCSDVCPRTLQILSEAFKNVSASSDYYGAFVSIDGDNDTAQSADLYAKKFSPKLQGYRLPSAETEQLIDWAQAGWSKDVDGRISHSTSIFLVSPDGEVVGQFINPADPKAIAEVFDTISRQ